MSNDVLMARTRLPAGHLDLGIGEPHVLRDLVVKAFDLGSFSFNNLPKIWEYAPPNGYGPLVKLLEEAYQAPVVVTAGAKHGIFATLHAVREHGAKSVAYRKPYWSSFPYMMERAGLRSVTSSLRADAHLLVMPNNPDGHVYDPEVAQAYCNGLIPVIHDAAYYTPSYMEAAELQPLGDMQVFSVSKMYGLSGLRLGWVVCRNPAYYSQLTSFVEATTAGISTASQRILMHLIEVERADPSIRHRYATEMRKHLVWAHQKLNDLDPEVLIPERNLGMFGWCRKGPRFNALKARVNVMDGAAFGDSEKVRLNLAVSRSTLTAAVKRFNQR
jgi:aspartate/methionine/tyrosine aminotransferase